VVIYPGTNPKDMEQLVVDPMEKKINELDDMKHVITDIRDGLAVMQVQYKYSSAIPTISTRNWCARSIVCARSYRPI
jgi:multidrug efflux pump subunit AcrB